MSSYSPWQTLEIQAPTPAPPPTLSSQLSGITALCLDALVLSCGRKLPTDGEPVWSWHSPHDLPISKANALRWMVP